MKRIWNLLVAFLAVTGLLVVIVIDRPFTGVASVHPTALAEVLADVESQPDEPR